MTTDTTPSVPQIIADQIGGRAFYMMGTSFKTGDSKNGSLFFNIKGSRVCNRIRIILDAAKDLYNVEFIKTRGLDFKVVSSVEGVYADMMKEVIEQTTGLYLSL